MNLPLIPFYLQAPLQHSVGLAFISKKLEVRPGKMEPKGQIFTTMVLVSVLLTLSVTSTSAAPDSSDIKANRTASAGHPLEVATTTEALATTQQSCYCPPPPECPKIDNSHAESLEDHAQAIPHISKKNFVYVFVSFVGILVAVYLVKGYLARKRQMDSGI